MHRHLHPMGLVVGVLFLLSSAPSRAVTFAVNTKTDAPDAAPGNGICATAGGLCTLRAAIQEANSLPGADAVTLTAGTYALITGELGITEDLAITGVGVGLSNTKISGSNKSRVFRISGPAAVTISGMKIANGRAPVGQNGAGVYNDGGSVSLANVSVEHNGSGGGLYNNGGNVSLATVGLRLNRGGSFVNNGGSATLTNVNIHGYRALGVANINGTVTLTGVSMSNNWADQGGGLFNSGTATLTNVTMSGNVATLGGGGLYNSGTATLTNVTISCNHCDRDCGGGIVNATGATVTLKNTMVADNWGKNCAGAALTSLGHNLDNLTTCGFAGPGDLVNAQPFFSRLALNGAFTQTQGLRHGSAAIDAGDPSGCPGTDQRGVARPQGAACDIGAYEFQP